MHVLTATDELSPQISSWTVQSLQPVQYTVLERDHLFGFEHTDVLLSGSQANALDQDTQLRRFLVIDETVDRYYGDEIRRYLRHHHVEFRVLSLPSFEQHKSMDAVFHITEEVKKLIYTSSALIYGPTQHMPLREFYPPQPLVPYSTSKLMGEMSCLSFFHTYRFPITIARLFCVYGPDEDPQCSLVEVSRYLRWHLNHQPIQVVGDIDLKTRDYIHIHDVIKGLLLLAEKGNIGEIFNVGSGQEVSMQQLIDMISSVTERKATVDNDTSTTADSYRQVADISKLQALGYKPRVSLIEGIIGLREALGERPTLPGISQGL